MPLTQEQISRIKRIATRVALPSRDPCDEKVLENFSKSYDKSIKKGRGGTFCNCPRCRG